MRLVGESEINSGLKKISINVHHGRSIQRHTLHRKMQRPFQLDDPLCEEEHAKVKLYLPPKTGRLGFEDSEVGGIHPLGKKGDLVFALLRLKDQTYLPHCFVSYRGLPKSYNTDMRPIFVGRLVYDQERLPNTGNGPSHTVSLVKIKDFYHDPLIFVNYSQRNLKKNQPLSLAKAPPGGQNDGRPILVPSFEEITIIQSIINGLGDEVELEIDEEVVRKTLKLGDFFRKAVSEGIVGVAERDIEMGELGRVI